MAGNELNWKTAFKKILLKDEPLQSEVEQNVNNQHVFEHDSRGDTEKFKKVHKQLQENEPLQSEVEQNVSNQHVFQHDSRGDTEKLQKVHKQFQEKENSKFLNSQHLKKYDSKADSEKFQKEVHEQFNCYYKSSTSNFHSSKGLRDEVPKWDNAFKDILGEKKQSVQLESDFPCTSSINSEAIDYAYLTSRLIKKENDKPHQKKPKPMKIIKKKELTPEEKKVEELFAMCINFKPVAKFTLNDFDGAGINVFKTLKPNSEGSNIVNDKNEDSDALYDKTSKNYEQLSNTNVGVEWTKTTSYTFEDAKKAKDKIVLTEVWELDDSFINHSTKTNKNPSVRRYKRYK